MGGALSPAFLLPPLMAAVPQVRLSFSVLMQCIRAPEGQTVEECHCFTDEETKAQRWGKTCSRSLSQDRHIKVLSSVSGAFPRERQVLAVELLPLGCSCPSPIPAGWPPAGDCPLRLTSPAFSASPPGAPAGLSHSFSTFKHRDLEQAVGVSEP